MYESAFSSEGIRVLPRQAQQGRSLEVAASSSVTAMVVAMAAIASCAQGRRRSCGGLRGALRGAVAAWWRESRSPGKPRMEGARSAFGSSARSAEASPTTDIKSSPQDTRSVELDSYYGVLPVTGGDTVRCRRGWTLSQKKYVAC